MSLWILIKKDFTLLLNIWSKERIFPTEDLELDHGCQIRILRAFSNYFRIIFSKMKRKIMTNKYIGFIIHAALDQGLPFYTNFVYKFFCFFTPIFLLEFFVFYTNFFQKIFSTKIISKFGVKKQNFWCKKLV